VTADEEFWFKIPNHDLYKLLPEFGGYAHGTVALNGPITNESVKRGELEYALRPSMFTGENTKTKRLWNKILKYQTSSEELKACL
jgi:hypothetical protein